MHYARNAIPDHPLYAELDESRRSVAELLGVQPDEIAFTRSGTEALQNLTAVCSPATRSSTATWTTRT